MYSVNAIPLSHTPAKKPPSGAWEINLWPDVVSWFMIIIYDFLEPSAGWNLGKRKQYYSWDVQDEEDILLLILWSLYDPRFNSPTMKELWIRIEGFVRRTNNNNNEPCFFYPWYLYSVLQSTYHCVRSMYSVCCSNRNLLFLCLHYYWQHTGV